MKESILEDVKKNERTFDAFRKRVEHLLTDLLAEQEIEIHQISSRVKAFQSLSKKIDDKGEKYKSLDEITDIIGIRIITYLESDVDSISDLIEKEFIKDEENSIDKRKLKSDQFGYRSLHIVASFNADRCNLKEYRRYNGIKCEIQVRSILQHAWAEIEHDLGYKGEISIPEPYKRTFNRLSALLETTDIEFDRLKTELIEYKKDVPSLIISEPELVDINQASIESFLSTNPILIKAKNIIEKKSGNKLDGFGEKVIQRLKISNFNYIGELEKSLVSNEMPFLKFVAILVETKVEKGRGIQRAAPIMYFLHFLALKQENTQKLIDYFKLNEYIVLDESEIEEYSTIYKNSLLS